MILLMQWKLVFNSSTTRVEVHQGQTKAKSQLSLVQFPDQTTLCSLTLTINWQK